MLLQITPKEPTTNRFADFVRGILCVLYKTKTTPIHASTSLIISRHLVNENELLKPDFLRATHMNL